MAREWLTADDILPHAGQSLPGTMSGLQDFIRRSGWRNDARRSRPRFGRGGGFEYHVSLLPPDVRARISLADAAALSKAPPAASSALWAEFERLPKGAREKAEARLKAVNAVEAFGNSVNKHTAVAIVAREFEISTSTLWSWLSLCDGVARTDRLPALAPRHAGRTTTEPCDPRAWDALLADYRRPEQPAFAACHRRMLGAAARGGWSPIPSAKTLKRRIEREFPRAVQVLARAGREAAARIYPHQSRDRSVFHAVQAVNADGHRFDVFVKWEDGTVARPVMVAFQDLYSGVLLSHRIDRTENKEVVRLALADLVASYGVPELCFFDNGRQFASKWLTGRMATRFRFKVKDEEPEGILTALGIQVRWTTPYHGQSKPIERAFRDLCEEIAKHPACAGCYTGNKPTAKPDNYGARAMPIAEFRALVAAEIAAHNARPGRRTPIAKGRSFLAVLEESLDLPTTLVRRATAAQRRLLLMAAEGVTARKPTGEIQLEGNRYWSEGLSELAGRRVVVRFDPQDLKAGVADYTLDGRFVCEAESIADTGFDDIEAAREHARKRQDFIRLQRQTLQAERRLSIDDLASMLPRVDAPTPPAPRTVKLVVNGAPRPEHHNDLEDFGEGVALFAAGEVVPFTRKEEGGA
jgi:hypothetical protein